MNYRRKLFLAYLIVLLLVAGCVKNVTVSVDVTPKNSGKIIGEGEYEVGSKVYLQAQPNQGYIFDGWEENKEIIEEQKEYKFTIQSEKNLMAKFKKKTVKLNAEANNPTRGSISGDGSYLFNEKVILKAEPNENYNFIGWFNSSDKKVSNEIELEILANTNQKYIAKFESSEFSIELNANIEQAELFGDGKYNKGKKQFISAKKVYGYKFSHWEDKNGDIFSEKDGKMITVHEDLFLTAIYEKKEQEFYLGVSTEEILEILQSAYGTYFYIRDQHYGTMWQHKKTEEMKDRLSSGKYYISTQPNSFIKYPMNDGNPIEFQIKNIQVIDNKIIVKSNIKIPKLVNNIDKNKLKKGVKNNLVNVNEFFSNYLVYDLTKKNTYEKELHLKVENNEVVIEKFDKSVEIFSSYQEIFKELVYEPMEKINLQVENGEFSKIIFYYDGKKYIEEYSNEIFDNRDLYPKINIVFNNSLKFNFANFYKNLRSGVNKSLITDNQLFDDITFYEDKISDQLIMSIESIYGMNPHLVFSFYDIENKKFSYSKRIPGWLEDDLIINSPNDEYISYVYSDSSSIEKLEILNILNNKRLLINDYLKEIDIKSNSKTIFKNIKWSKESSGLIFELYLKINGNSGVDDKTLKIGLFNFDLDTKKLSRIIKKVDNSKI